MFQDLKSILPKAIKKAGITDKIKSDQVIEIFSKEVNNILSVDLAEKIQPLYIKDGILTIASLSEIAIKELQVKEDKILAKINEILGKNIIKEVRYLT